MKWIATCDNYGYQGQYWAKGDTVEAAKQPNEHFSKVAGASKEDTSATNTADTTQ